MVPEALDNTVADLAAHAAHVCQAVRQVHLLLLLHCLLLHIPFSGLIFLLLFLVNLVYTTSIIYPAIAFYYQ